MNEIDGSNLGREVESAVADICTKSFFPDTVVRSPKYRKTGGKQKEAADLLITLKDTVLIFQIKTRVLPTNSFDSFSEIEKQRFLRIISKAFNQFHALGEAVSNGKFEALTNDRGLPVDFKLGGRKRLFLIVVYATLLAGGAPTGVRVRLSKSCSADGPIPVHVFTFDEFATLAVMLDSLPDFARYLELRGDLQECELITKDADPLDVWALMTFEPERVAAAIERKETIITTGIISRHENSLKALEDKEKQSYIIDWILNELYAGSGRVIPVSDFIQSKSTESPGSFKAYQRQVPFFAQLNRWQRTQLAEALELCIHRSQDGGDSFKANKFPDIDEAYLILCSVGSRADRHLSMHNLALGLAYILKIHTVVCISTGPDGPKISGCDVMAVNVDAHEITSEIIAESKKWFGEPREVQG